MQSDIEAARTFSPVLNVPEAVVFVGIIGGWLLLRQRIQVYMHACIYICVCVYMP